ncbi:ABC-type spermidine/putrescine transport system permease subunit I [Bradyrhizobium sp. GM22.5]
MDTSEDILQQASPDLVRGSETARRSKAARLSPSFISWLQAGPMMLVFLAFFLIPLVFVVIVSFWDYNEYQLLPAFSGRGYTDTFEGCIAQLPDLCTIAKTYLKTLKLCFIVWVITLFIGFWVAYFLAFHVKSKTWQMGLSLLCTIPFWTSNVIRMIAWIPLLGRNGLVNSGLVKTGLIKPIPLNGCCSPNSPWCWRWCTSSPSSWWCRSSTQWFASTNR